MKLQDVAKQFFINKIWLEETPECIRDIMLKEKSTISLIDILRND